jgi:hypothetical protein
MTSKGISPTELTLREMRNRGYKCAITEHWNPFAKIRQDLFGFIDVLCLGDNEVIGVQATSYSNISARVKKIAEHENVGLVRKANIRILVIGWHKGDDNRWKFREVDCS